MGDATMAEYEAEHFQVIADALPALLSYVDGEHRYRYANATYERWFGERRDAIVGRHVSEVLGPDTWELVRPYMDRALAGEAVTYEQRLPYRAAGVRWVQVTYTPDVVDGRVRGFVVMVTDVGDRKAAEARVEALTDDLRARVEELQTLFDVLPIGIFVARDPARAEITINRAGAETLGDPPYRPLREGVEVPPDELPLSRSMRLDRAILGEEVEVERADGGHVHLWQFVSPLHDAAGRVRGAIGAFVDVTERNRAQRALRASEAEYRGLFDLASIGAAEADATTGRFIRCNRRFAELTGYSEQELLGLTFADITHPDDLEGDRARWLAAIASGDGWQSEKRYVRKDGRIAWVIVTGRVIRLPGEPPRTVAHILDITDRKELEERLRLGNEELLREDRLKDEFIATLAHELRNPLAPIRNAVSFLQLRPPADPQLVRVRDIVDRQVRQLTRLVDDLMDVSRIRRGTIELRRERVDVRTIVAAALETSQPLLDQLGHHLAVEIEDPPPWVDGDPTRLAQVVSNLLNNAAKYTDAGGHLHVVARRRGDRVEIRVADDGIGISPEMLPHVFDLFAQADRAAHRAQGGLGIGLTVVRRLVEMHGGEVEARSEGPGRGTEVVVHLPLAPAPDATDAVEASARHAPSLDVLVVDDNADAARTLADLLRATGQRVTVAFDGPAALRAAQAKRPDLVLLDLGMPDVDGYEVARRLRADPRTRGARLVALTGWGEPEARQRARDAGFDEHLVKPPDLDGLLATIRQAASRGAPS